MQIKRLPGLFIILGLLLATNIDAQYLEHGAPLNRYPVFTNLDSAIKYKKEVKNLYINYQIKDTEKLKIIGEFPNLEYLYLSSFYLPKLPSEILNSKKIRKLVLKGILLTELPGEIQNLDKLEYLAINSTKISEIPDLVGVLKNLKFLDFSNNRINYITDKINNCTQLQELYLNNNILSKLPESIGQLHQLEILEIAKNKLEVLPPGITMLKKLVRLDVSNNLLTSLPDDFNKLHNLATLYAHSNNLTAIPSLFQELHCLEILNLKDNPLADSPYSAFPASLKHLQVTNSQLTLIPDALKNCPDIESIDISSSNIIGIPVWIGQFSKLKFLKLVNNRIVRIPASIKKLNALEELYLSCNDIDTIPVEIFELPVLKTLYINDNPFAMLPSLHFKSKQLIMLNILSTGIQSNNLHQFKNTNGQEVQLLPDEAFFVDKGTVACCLVADTIPEAFTRMEISPRFLKESLPNTGCSNFFANKLSFLTLKTLNGATKVFTDTVIIKFVVRRNGGIMSLTPVTYTFTETKKEALRLLELSCAYWLPATMGGRRVDAWYQIQFIMNQYYKGNTLKKDLSILHRMVP